MEDGLQHAAAHRQSLVRDTAAVVRLAPGVHVAALHALRHRHAVGQEAPQRAAGSTPHGDAVHVPGCVPLPDLFADPSDTLKDAVRRGSQDPLAGFAADEAGDAGVGQGGAVVDHPAQVVAPHGLHHRMAVHPGGEAGARGHHYGGHVDGCAQVPLGQDGIHHRVGHQRVDTGPGGVHQHGDHPLGQDVRHLLQVRPAGRDALHHRLPQAHCLGEADRAADGGGAGRFTDDHLHACPVQAQGDAGGDVAAASDHDKHVHSPL